MDYRVEQLAAAAQIPVDTLRFYQARGLLPAPRREGRIALYGAGHLERLAQIRALQQQGFSLAQIRRVLDAPARAAREPLLDALIQESVGARSYGRAEFAAESGMPEAMLLAAERAGLFEPVVVDGEPRFVEADLGMARAGLALLEAGIPLADLLGLATRHARSVQDACDAAIELFDASVRKGAADEQQVARVFQQLLPQVTRLVALHFQRTLLSRALERFRGRREYGELARALATSDAARLDVEVTWR
jgi:DNA-binding transcriptional MerR regulator